VCDGCWDMDAAGEWACMSSSLRGWEARTAAGGFLLRVLAADSGGLRAGMVLRAGTAHAGRSRSGLPILLCWNVPLLLHPSPAKLSSLHNAGAAPALKDIL
jgi:hypothetical protein